MPLIRSPKNLQKGDFVVYLYYPARTHRFELEFPDEWEAEPVCYDWMEVCLGEFYELRQSSVFGGECYTLSCHSHCEFDAASYSGHEFDKRSERFNFKTLYSPNAVEIFGVVNGSFDRKDYHTARKFLRRLVKQYRPVLLYKYRQYMKEVECPC